MACSVCWRPAASARPRVSSRNRSSSSPAISAGRSAATRAAASSIASGIPSSRRQISPDRGHVRRGQREVAARGGGPLDEQATPRRWPRRPPCPRPGAAATAAAARRPAPRPRPAPAGWWPGCAPPRQPRRMSAASAAAAASQVLAVVQHQQQRGPGPQELHDAAGHGQAGPRAHPQRGQDGLRHRLPVPGRVPARTATRRRAKDGSWSAAACSASRVLPTPPGPVTVTSGDRAIAAASPASSPARPTNELSWTGRFPANASSVRSGGKSARRPGPGQLEDPHRPGQIPQPVLPQVHQGAPVRQVLAHQQLRRPRHQRLPAMPGGHQPGAPVQRLVQVLLPAQHPLIGQQPHPRRQRPGHLRPVLRAQALLRRQHRPDRLPGRGEHRGHPVAHRGEHHPADAIRPLPARSRHGAPARPASPSGAPPTGASTPPGR